MHQNQNQKILRLAAVIDLTGLSRSTIYAMKQNGLFPESVALGARSVGWLETDVQNWIASRKTGGARK